MCRDGEERREEKPHILTRNDIGIERVKEKKNLNLNLGAFMTSRETERK